MFQELNLISMRRSLLIIFLGLLFFLSLGLNGQVVYKVKFIAYAAFDYPCNDGDDGYLYTVTSQSCYVTFTVKYPDNSTKSLSRNSIEEFTETAIEVKASGSATVNYSYKGSTFTISETFDESDYEKITFSEFSGECGDFIFQLEKEITDLDCAGEKRIIRIMCRLRIMPHKELMIGQKLCTGEPIELEAYDGSIEYDHDWYARINEVEWFSLDRSGASETIYIDNIYSKAPMKEILDDSTIPPIYYYVPIEFVPGDKIELVVDHSCPEFNFMDNPYSGVKQAYQSPENPDYITPNSPICADSLDGSISIGLINGISPTYFSYSLHEVVLQAVKPAKCSNSIAASDLPLEYPESSGNWYCATAVGGNYSFSDDDAQNVIELDVESSDGGITGIFEGDWLIYIKQDDPEAFCENYYVRHISDPLQPALTSLDIPSYSYSTNEYNLPYQGASETVKFIYTSETLTNDIIIDGGDPVAGGENSGEVVGLTAGTYELKINDEKGCPFDIPNIPDKLEGGEFTLIPPGPLNLVDTIKDPVLCHHENVNYTTNGEVQIQVFGGVGPYDITVGTETLQTNPGNPEGPYKLIFENLAYGFHTYDIETVNYDGETLTGTIFIEEPDPLELWIDTIKNPICFPNPDGEIKFHGGGGTPIYDFFLNEVERISNKDESNDSIGGLYINIDYTLQINDINDCITEFDFRMDEFADPLEFYVLDTLPARCIGGNSGKIYIKGQGGHDDIYNKDDILGFEFQKLFNVGDSTIEISDLESDIDYPVIITDSENCQYSQIINIEPNPTPVFPQIIDSLEIQCNSYDNAWIEVTGLQGDTLPGGYKYYLSDVDHFTTNNIDLGDTSLVKSGSNTKFYNLTPGQHTVYVSDTNDCLNSDITATSNVYKTNFYVFEPDIIEVSYDHTGVSQKGESDAKLWFTATGGNESYHFELESADTLVSSGSTNDSILIDNLAEGQYTLKLKDTCDCTNGGINVDWIQYSGIIIKSPNEILTLHTGAVNPTTCFAGNNGSVSIYGQGGWEGTGYIYGIDSVDVVDNTGIFENLVSGWYLFHVKDSANVVVYDSIFVPQPKLLETSIKDISDVQCHNGSDGEISLSVTGGIKPYEFSLDGSTWQTDSVFTSLSKNNYTLHVKDINGCETTVTAEINHPEPYSVSYTVTETLCGESNGSINCSVLGGTAPYTFQWESGDSIVGTESLLNNLYSGEYYVTITDAHSCDTSFLVFVSNTDGPQSDLEFIDTVSCIGQTDGAIHYSLSEGITPYNIKLYTGSDLVQETQIAFSGSYTFENLESATYNIIISDFNNCIGSISAIILPEPESVSLIIDTIADPVCYGYDNGEISVHATGGNGDYIYQWSTGLSGNRIDNLLSGTYSVSAIDSKGCINESTYELINPEKLSVEIGDDEVICEGQLYPLSAQGFNTYNWVYNGDYISSASEIEVWAAGEYVLQVSDFDGCMAEDTFHLSISNDLLEAEFIMPSEVLETDTVVAIDISWPEPENVEWSFSSGIIEINSEDYAEEFTFSSPGIYTVSLTSYKAMCVDSVSKQIVVLADTTSMEKSILGANPLIKTFKVFPNPNNGQFYVQVELDYISDITVDLYNLQQNRLVFRQNGSGQSNYNMEYGFTNLQQGVYLVILYVENEKRTERVLIF